MSYTGWRRLIESPKLQIIFHKRATKYRSLLRKMTYKDKGSYESSPPCTCIMEKCSGVLRCAGVIEAVVMCSKASYTHTHTHTNTHIHTRTHTPTHTRTHTHTHTHIIYVCIYIFLYTCVFNYEPLKLSTIFVLNFIDNTFFCSMFFGIIGEASMCMTHHLRARHDAILVCVRVCVRERERERE